MSKPSAWSIVRLQSGSQPAERGRMYADGRYAGNEQVDQNDPLLALVPADRCNVISIDLPELSGRKLEQALRWAAEDAIAGPIEEQHVAPIQREADGRLRCIVSSRQDMQQWLDSLPRRPQRMLPDAACLPWQAGQISLMQQGRHWLMRWAETGFDRIEADLLDVMLPELVATETSNIVCYQTANDAALPDVLSALEPECIVSDIEPLALLAPPAIDSPVNLMYGDYSPIEPGSRSQRWRLAAVLCGIVALMTVVLGISENWLLARESDQLEQQINQQFRQIFPEITRIQRPRVQAEQAMALLSGGGSDPFLGMASRISQLLSGATGIDVESLNYAAGQINLALKAPGTDDLEALQQQLRRQQLDVTVEQLQVLPDGVQARLRIQQAAGL